MKVLGIVCPKCDDLVYSRTLHDRRSCKCKSCSIDGGQERIKISVGQSITPKTVQLNVPFTSEELYADYNDEVDELGVVPSVKKVTAKQLKLQIEYTKRALDSVKDFFEGGRHSLFSNQLKRLQQSYARLNGKIK